MIVIPASLRSDFIHMAGMTIHIALESTIHIVGIRSQGHYTQNPVARSARSLLFIPILAGDIILRHLMRANLLLASFTSVFHARHCVGLERVSFLDQLGHTLRIRTFDVGQSL
jgi:hypothetical protein